MAASMAHRQQTSHANTHDSGDFPIVIGESLKNNTSPRSELLRLRYNWKPEQGFESQKGVMKHAKGDVQLAYKDEKTEATSYGYKSATNSSKPEELEKSMNRLVLIFDPDRSAYVLERISHSVDLNLVSAHDQSQSEIEAHKPVDNSTDGSATSQSNAEPASAAQDEDKADPTNPFDFRHFLSEAKDNAEKASQPAGGRTPVPGNRTPMSVISSPSLVPGRFLSSNTTQLRQIPTSTPTVAKKSQSSKPAASLFSKKQTATNKRKTTTSAPKVSASQPLSKEIISDSSDESSSNAVTASRPSASQNDDRGRDRDASPVNVTRSPNNLVYSEGGLEIDMGSPPRETKKRGNLDVGAFRSGTHTPTLGISSSSRRPPLHSHMDMDMKDASESEQDVNSEENDIVDEDMDEDVDVLELGSPRSKKADQQRQQSDQSEQPPAPPTPQPPPPEDDEDEDFLANELAKAMEQDNEPTNFDDDESEVSEEE